MGTNGAGNNGAGHEPHMRWDIPDDAAEPEVSEEVSTAFLQQMDALENGPWTTHFAQLERAGIELPPAESLDDAALHDKLWQIIEKLADLRVFLYSTDHLSDRELYAHLWNEALREDVPDMEVDESSAWHLDLVSSGSEEDIRLWLTYYADDEDRERWAEQFPGEPIPDHEDPPYDRDSRLPQRSYTPPDEDDEPW